MRIVLAFVALFSLSIVPLVRAEPQLEAVVEGVLPVERTRSIASARGVEQRELEIRAAWQGVAVAVTRSDREQLQRSVHELVRLQKLHRYRGMEEAALGMLAHARNLPVGSEALRNSLVQSALQVAPTSFAIAAQAYPLLEGGRSAVITQAISGLFEPVTAVTLALLATYPLLWSLTLALVLVLLMLVVWHIKSVLRELQRVVPGRSEGLAGIFLIVVVALPLLAGPLPAVATWSLLVLVTVRHRRVIAFGGGLLIGLWGALLPIRENCSRWFSQPGAQAVVEIARDRENFPFDQEGRLLGLKQLSHDRPDDAVIQFAFGQALKRLGNYEEALERMTVAAAHSPDRRFAEAEVATIHMLRGELEKSLSDFERLYGMGFRDPRFLYNFSLLRFELTDTEGSRRLFEEAQSADRALIREYVVNQEEQGITRGVANMVLPWSSILSSLVSPMYAAERREDVLADQLFRGTNPVMLMGLGFLIAMMYFLVRTQGAELHARVAHGSYRHPALVRVLFRLVPGGAWVISGRVGRAWALLTICVLALFPLVYWPHEANGMLEVMPGIRPVYACVLGIATLLVLFRGFYLTDQFQQLRLKES